MGFTLAQARARALNFIAAERRKQPHDEDCAKCARCKRETLVWSNIAMIAKVGRCCFCHAMRKLKPEVRALVEQAVANGQLVCFNQKAVDTLKRIAPTCNPQPLGQFTGPLED